MLGNISHENDKYGDCYHYSGAIHFHTQYSDGSGTYAEIAKTASSLGMKFIIPTDHDTVEPFTEENFTYMSGVLVIPAVEISTNNFQGHFLVIGDEVPVLPNKDLSTDAAFKDYVSKGMLTFVAHAYHPNPKFDWHQWDIGEFTGMELFNLDSNWRLSLSFKQMSLKMIAVILGGFRKTLLEHVIHFPKRAMEKFDELLKKRKVVGIGVTDAHSRITIAKWIKQTIRFPSYKNMFNIVATVIVSRERFRNDYKYDRKLLLNALRQGNSFIAFPYFGNTLGFQFTASSDTATAILGETLIMNRKAVLKCILPANTNISIQIIRNGKTIFNEKFSELKEDLEITHEVEKEGVYRIQALHHRKMPPFRGYRTHPLIISNPIYVEKA